MPYVGFFVPDQMYGGNYGLHEAPPQHVPLQPGYGSNGYGYPPAQPPLPPPAQQMYHQQPPAQQQYQHQPPPTPSYGQYGSTVVPSANHYTVPPPAAPPSYAAPPPLPARYPPAYPHVQQPLQQSQPQYSQYQQPARPPQPSPQPPQPILQQPSPWVLADPNAFKTYYANELQQLTFNSKPLINHLTILAGDHASRMAHVIAQCLEDHVKQSPPSTKLTALYLLDSVCKNIGPPYTLLFARTIDRIFLTAYREVDPQTKVKFEELLGTWRNGAQDGGELFKLAPSTPPGVRPAQKIIEETLFGPPPTPSYSPVPPHPSQLLQQSRPSPPSMQQPVQDQHRPPVAPSYPQHQSNGYAHATSPPPPQLPALPPQSLYNSQPSTPSSLPPPPPGLPAMPPKPLGTALGANNVERAAVLFDLRKLLDARRDQAAYNPGDLNNRDQIQTLVQLEQLVQNTQLQPAQILQIRDQLARLGSAPTSSITSRLETAAEDNELSRERKRPRLISPPPPNMMSPPLPSVLDSIMGTSAPPAPRQQLAVPQPMMHLPAGDLATLSQLLNPDILRSASAQSHLPRSNTVSPPPSILNTPLQSYSHTQTNHNYSNSYDAPPHMRPAPVPVDPQIALDKAANEAAVAGYEDHRMHFYVPLVNSDIARYRPGSSALLYEALPLRCKQCGSRYLDCPLGKRRFARDLDRHLRITKRYNDGIQRGIGRNWFVAEDEWVLPPAAIQPSEAVIKAEEVKKKAAATAELLSKTVPVPTGAAANDEPYRCPICKEEFKNEYSEDDEDWIWRNAVDVDGIVYHASCKAEQMAAK